MRNWRNTAEAFIKRRWQKAVAAWTVLTGSEQLAMAAAKRWLASVLRETALIAAAGAAVWVVADAASGGGLLGLAAAWPLLRERMLVQRLTERRYAIVRELPEFLNGLILLVNAGEPVQQAMRAVGQRYAKRSDSPLGTELNHVIAQLNNRMPFSAALELFHQRCATPEVSMLTTTLLLNMRRGGYELTVTLRELSRNLWEKRKTAALIRGEQASSKLIFPLMLMFGAVLLIVAAPALMSIQ